MSRVNAGELLPASRNIEAIRTAFFWDHTGSPLTVYLAEKLRFGQGWLLRDDEYIYRFIGNSRFIMLRFLNITEFMRN